MADMYYSARFEATLSLVFAQAQFNDESAMQRRKRDVFLRLVTKLKMHFGSKEPSCMVHE